MTDDQPLHFREFGPAEAPPIVFLHGGGVSGWMWQPVVDRLPHYRCLVPDLPEQGGSAAVGPFSMHLAAQKVADLISMRLNGSAPARVMLVGLSEGAQVGVQLLADLPGLVECALLSSPLLRPIPGAGWASSPGWLRWTYRLTVAPLKNSDFWIRLNMRRAAGVPEVFFPQVKRDFQAVTEEGFVNIMSANQRFRLPQGLHRVHTRVLAVAGSREYAIMKQSVRDLAAALPVAKAVQIDLGPHSNMAQEHNWALTAPDLFARTVQAWMEEQPLPAGLIGLE